MKETLTELDIDELVKEEMFSRFTFTDFPSEKALGFIRGMIAWVGTGVVFATLLVPTILIRSKWISLQFSFK